MKKTEKVSVLPRCREKLFSQDLSTRASHAVVSHRLNLVTRNLNDLKKLQTNIIEKWFLELAGIQPTAKKKENKNIPLIKPKTISEEHRCWHSSLLAVNLRTYGVKMGKSCGPKLSKSSHQSMALSILNRSSPFLTSIVLNPMNFSTLNLYRVIY